MDETGESPKAASGERTAQHGAALGLMVIAVSSHLAFAEQNPSAPPPSPTPIVHYLEETPRGKRITLSGWGKISGHEFPTPQPTSTPEPSPTAQPLPTPEPTPQPAPTLKEQVEPEESPLTQVFEKMKQYPKMFQERDFEDL